MDQTNIFLILLFTLIASTTYANLRVSSTDDQEQQEPNGVDDYLVYLFLPLCTGDIIVRLLIGTASDFP